MNAPTFGAGSEGTVGPVVHDLPAGSLANVDGNGTYVRVQVLTNAGALDRDKQLAVENNG
jgi:hypothetical protein